MAKKWQKSSDDEEIEEPVCIDVPPRDVDWPQTDEQLNDLFAFVRKCEKEIDLD